MPGFNPDNINIHDLTIEEPEQKSELPFDPETNITEEEWEKIESLLKEKQKQYYPLDFIELASSIRILNPKKIKNIELAHEKEGLIAHQLDTGGTGYGAMETASQVKIVCPEYDFTSSEVIKKMATLKEFEFQKRRARESRAEGANYAYDWFPRFAMALKILEPNMGLDIEESDWNHIGEDLERKKKKDLAEAITYAVAIKILNPSYSLNFSGEDWENMINETLRHRERNLEYFFELSAKLKILAAQEVRVTENGLEIHMRKEKEGLQDETPSMPEGRKF